MNPTEMNKTTPTEEGWYWVWNNYNEPYPERVYKCDEIGELCVNLLGYDVSIKELNDWLWLRILPEPKMPQEQ